MPNGISVPELTGLIALTQKQLGEGKITDLSTDLQEYYALPMLMDKSNVETLDGGVSVERTLNLQDGTGFKWTQPFAVDTNNIVDNIAKVNVPWRFGTSRYAFDINEQMLNSSDRQIFDLIKLRKHLAKVGTADGIENAWWGKPVDSSDATTMWGVDMWIVDSQTAPAAANNFGFSGQNPAGFSSVGGVDTSLAKNARYRNYTDTYTNISKTDALVKMRQAYKRTMFKPPVPGMPTYATSGKGPRCQIYTNINNQNAFETIGENQNENLGRDVASMDGQIVFRGCPINWVPKLDTDARNPIYMINWSHIRFFVQRGRLFVESPPKEAANQHTVIEVFTDSTLNTICTDRRPQAILVSKT